MKSPIVTGIHHKNYNGHVLNYLTCEHLLQITTNWTEWNDVWRKCIHKFWQFHFTVKIVAEPTKSTRTNFCSAVYIYSTNQCMWWTSQTIPRYRMNISQASKCLHHCQYDWSMTSILKMEFNAPSKRLVSTSKTIQSKHAWLQIEKKLEIKILYPYYMVRDVTTCKQTMHAISGGLYHCTCWCDFVQIVYNKRKSNYTDKYTESRLGGG